MQTGCPSDAEIDNVTDWQQAVSWGAPYNSTATAKAYIRENCTEAPNHQALGGRSDCITKIDYQYYEATLQEYCGGPQRFYGQPRPKFCRGDPDYINETCAMAMGAVFQTDESVTRVIMAVGVGLVYSCRGQVLARHARTKHTAVNIAPHA